MAGSAATEMAGATDVVPEEKNAENHAPGLDICEGKRCVCGGVGEGEDTRGATWRKRWKREVKE